MNFLKYSSNLVILFPQFLQTSLSKFMVISPNLIIHQTDNLFTRIKTMFICVDIVNIN